MQGSAREFLRAEGLCAALNRPRGGGVCSSSLCIARVKRLTGTPALLTLTQVVTETLRKAEKRIKGDMRTSQSDSQRGNLCLLLADISKKLVNVGYCLPWEPCQYLGSYLRCSTVAEIFHMMRVCS